MRRARSAVWGGMITLLISACSDQPTRPAAAGGPVLTDSNPSASPADDRPDEAEMLGFARQLPSIAGYHFAPGGDLVVGVTDSRDAAAARALLAGVARRGSGQVQVRPAQYRFLELRGWRDAIAGPLVEIRGVTMLDLDEMANQVVVGVSEPSVRAAVVELARGIGIPVPALGFVQAGYPELMSLEVHSPYLSTAPAQGDSITSYRRPLEGGLQIAYRASSDPDKATLCTLGFIAVHDGRRVGVSAGHCSQRMWDLDGVSYFQNRPGAGRYIGYEVRDPNATSCGFLSPNVCRHSEGMLMHLETDVPGEIGYIVRPVGPAPLGVSPYGTKVSSLQVDAADPKFRIVGQRAPGSGDIVHKVGIASGWTRGKMHRTCIDVPADRDWSWMRCQSLAEVSITSGDSGAPVFVDHENGTATLVGLAWGTVIMDGVRYAAFSSVPQLEKDLGALNTYSESGSGGGSTDPDPGPVCDPECMT